MLPPGLYPQCGTGSYTRPRRRFHHAHCFHDLVVEIGIFGIVGNGQYVDATAGIGDMTVAQIPAEQVRIRRLVQVGAVAPRAGRTLEGRATREATALVEPAPAPDRLDRDAVDEGVLSVCDTKVGQSQRRINGVLRTNVAHTSIIV
jgi:hypothetical protein